MVYNGIDYPWLPDTHAVIGQQKEDYLDGIAIARRSVGDLFTNGPPPVPEYDSDGIFRQSLIPFGQLGSYWFFRDDPGSVCAVPYHPRMFEEGAADYFKSRVKMYV